MKALSRNTDPETSHEAARKVEGSGKATSQRIKCLQQVLLFPNSTAGEISHRIQDMNREACSKRLAELRHSGIIENGPIRECEIFKSNMMVWRSVFKFPTVTTEGGEEQTVLFTE